MSFVPSENSRASLLLAYVLDQMDDVSHQVTYRQICEICGIPRSEDATESMLVSGVVGEVNKRLHRSGDWRQLVNVPNVGYKIGTPAELRELVLGRHRHVQRQMLSMIRESEAVIRHPDSTAGERKRAADATAAQAALLQMVRRDQRRIRRSWHAEEISPVSVIEREDEERAS